MPDLRRKMVEVEFRHVCVCFFFFCSFPKFCRSSHVFLPKWKRKIKMERVIMSPPPTPFVESSQPGVGVGHANVCLPLQRLQSSTLPLAHTPLVQAT